MNWKESYGVQHHERADATKDIFDRNIIEARYNWAISRLRRRKVRTVLDLGCGLGYGTNLVFKAGFKVEGIDKSATAIDICRQRYPYIDFTYGRFPGIRRFRYDAIIANEIIEHVQDYRKFIEKCFGCIDKKGILLLTTPNPKYSTNKNPHHKHEFSLGELKVMLPKSKIRGLRTRLLRGQWFLLIFIREELLQRMVLRLSLFPIIHHLPQYSRYFAIEVENV